MKTEQNAYSIYTILNEFQFIVPIYQRNYAWDKIQIEQLIDDINDFFTTTIQNNQELQSSKSYYIGSLVYFKRHNGLLELIDGQQRQTTITLINAVLNDLRKRGKIILENHIPIDKYNINFDARKNSQRFIEDVYHSMDQIEQKSYTGVANFVAAIQIIKDKLAQVDLETFAHNFYHQVRIFLVEVPQDTDLNHYFEIMNNRGEQLEKHEIIKAKLMHTVDDNFKFKFAKIWDICADMGDYIWNNFDSKNRQNSFTDNGDLVNNDLSSIHFENVTNEREESLLFEILEKEDQTPYDLSKFNQNEVIVKDRYRSVIDFPNFLLQVLKLKNETISLDDKKLIEQFENIDGLEFITDLLLFRIKFDQYVIKQDLSDADSEKQNWEVRKYNKSNETYTHRFSHNSELVKLQTMLYYSNPSNTNNNWLQAILRFEQPNHQEAFTLFLFNYAKDRFNPDDLVYPAIPTYNFYYIDFLLWKLYREQFNETNQENESANKCTNDKIIALQKRIKQNAALFHTFKFRQLSSKEHLLPQSEATDKQKLVLDHLGNLCLISAAQNSSANNKHPSYKLKSYKDNSSLKRLMMYETFNGDNWGVQEIQTHEEEILALLDYYNQ